MEEKKERKNKRPKDTKKDGREEWRKGVME